MRPITPKDFAEAMKKLFPETGYDEEDAHWEADRAMCEVLRQHGYEEGVETFLKASKWYA